MCMRVCGLGDREEGRGEMHKKQTVLPEGKTSHETKTEAGKRGRPENGQK